MGQSAPTTLRASGSVRPARTVVMKCFFTSASRSPIFTNVSGRIADTGSPSKAPDRRRVGDKSHDGFVVEYPEAITMKKAALYARVSTPDQHLENQILDLRKLAAQRGFEIVGEYCDRGISGTKAKRPGLEAMMKDSRRGEF